MGIVEGVRKDVTNKGLSLFYQKEDDCISILVGKVFVSEIQSLTLTGDGPDKTLRPSWTRIESKHGKRGGKHGDGSAASPLPKGSTRTVPALPHKIQYIRGVQYHELEIKEL
jgi:hypothetical protein